MILKKKGKGLTSAEAQINSKCLESYSLKRLLRTAALVRHRLHLEIVVSKQG